MAYQLTQLTFVKARPSDDSDSFASLGRDVILFATGTKYKDPDTQDLWVNVLVPPGNLDGWIPARNAVEIADPAPQPVDQAAFVRQCTLADRMINGCVGIEPWYTTADFVIARAILETGITQTHFDAPYCSGPFKLAKSEWEDFLGAKLPFSVDYDATDAIYPMLQVHAAGYRMHSDAKGISVALTAAQAGKDLGPFLPSYLDIFHAYLGGIKFAVDLKNSETDATKSLSDVLDPAALTSLLNRPQFGDLQESSTLPVFVAKSETVLAQALDAAFDKLRTFAADELPTNATPAPWLDVAKAELALKVSEKTAPDRIKAYFSATDYGPVGAAIPNWCGAFAAFCMKQSGGTVPKGSATAANWKAWGTRNVPLGSHDIPQGSVIVLSPAKGTNTSGHVGFFTGFTDDGKSVNLLGGNQSNAVTIMPSLVPRIVAIRAPDDQSDSIGAANKFDLTAAGVDKKYQRYGDMIVDRFKKAGFTRDPQLIAALANAIAESGMNPDAKAGGSEQSYGLFQCNINHGLGIGFTIEQLKDPDTNIAIIIRAVQRYPAYASASSLEAAVDAFVRFVERPKDTQGAIAKRTTIAKKLL